ncbi:hypothetical protein RCIA46 [Methanocella arvoryzae MRE50]|uniref:Uncharacterized protein n=1 Tax=Methanocella arvoryzae (strain DSM 22066 / NBRC 105507 / MRE50) TaxID=351160 RepID=Q0W5X9_METAR|nr:hypothetical protein RCIA46 [Methanocella arvoryzae MRE50]
MRQQTDAELCQTLRDSHDNRGSVRRQAALLLVRKGARTLARPPSTPRSQARQGLFRSEPRGSLKLLLVVP